jgi:hypothetical protein
MRNRDEFKRELNVEACFIVDMLRAHVQQKETPKIPKGINWRKFIELCYATHFAGIISDLIKLLDTAEIPKAVFEQLKSYQLRVITSNERLLHHYNELEKIAKEENLTLYPLKGITLMPQLYKQRFHRHLSDIDVLIDSNQLFHWENTLTKNGFRIKRRVAKSAFHEKHDLKYDPLQAFKRDAVIDFHTSLNSGFNHLDIPIESLQRNHEHSHELNQLDQLIFVCVHAYKHLYYGQLNLLHLLDILLLKKEISSKALWERCARFNCTNEVQQAINTSLFFFGENDRKIPFWQSAVLKKELGSKRIPISTKWLFAYRKHLRIAVSLFLLPSYLWFQIFPSAAYLRQSDGHTFYLTNWIRRISRLLTNR